jgi:hypothetical protein
MRSFVRSISAFGLLAATSLAGCGAQDQGVEAEAHLSELQISQARAGVIRDDPTYVRADVLPINQSNFALLYQHAADGMHHLVRYTIPAPGTQPAVVQNPGQFNLGVDSNFQGFTVRANTSPPLGRNKLCSIGTGFGNYNYAAVQQLGKVSLDTHSFSTLCGGWSFSRMAIDDGIRPSVATKGSGSSGKALIVYGSPLGQVLRGRVLSWSTNPFTGARSESLGAAFNIATMPFPRTVRSTDVVYSPATDRFIVGFTSSSSTTCVVQNIVLDGSTTTPAVLRGEQTFGNCDATSGGNPTYAALSSADATDMYLWSRTDTSGRRGVFAHRTSDGLLSFPAPMVTNGSDGTNLTNPVAGSSSATRPYVVLYGHGNGNLAPVEAQIYALELPNRTFGRLENSFAPPGAPIAIGSAPTATLAVSAVKDPVQPGVFPTMTLRMDISDQR